MLVMLTAARSFLNNDKRLTRPWYRVVDGGMVPGITPSRRGVRDCGIGVLLLVNDRLGNHDADWGLSGRSFSERAAFQKNLA
jgi:hypothetical protein